MIVRRAEPNVHLRIGIEIVICEAEEAGFITEVLADALDERTEIQSHQIHFDADCGEILLYHRRHALASLVAGIGDE